VSDVNQLYRMRTYISILRGINVSGQKIIKMDVLMEVYSGLGFSTVQTYIQSGNVIFRNIETSTKDLEKKLAEQIKARFGFDVPVIVMDLVEFNTVVRNNPFVNIKNMDVTKLHVTFMSDMPEMVALDKISGYPSETDEFIVAGKSIYLFCPNGYGNTKLSNTFFEKRLNVTATTRNWKTLNTLFGLANKPNGN